MRTILFFLILLPLSAKCQDYIASWTPTGSSYEVQRSSDGKNWKRITTTSATSYNGSKATYYWRVKDNKGTYSNVVWVYSMATITNVRLYNGKISWRSYTETNLTNYTIESQSGIIFVNKKGYSTNYSVPVAQSNQYSIIAHYKNGDKHLLKTLP